MFLKFYLFYVLYINVLVARIYVNCVHACCLQRPEERTGSPGTGITIVKHLWVLGPEPGSSRRPVRVLR